MLWISIGAVLLVGGVVAAVVRKSKGANSNAPKEEKFTLEGWIAKCRSHLQNMRTRAMSIRDDHGDREFYQIIINLCSAYDKTIAELQEDSLDIMKTGAIESRLERLQETLVQWLQNKKKSRFNKDFVPGLEQTKKEFREILEKVETTLRELQKDDDMEHRIKMNTLLHILVPEKYKLTEE